MDCKALFLLAAFCAQSVLGSHYHGAVAKPVVLKSGYLADTDEVAAAKSTHPAALAKEYYHGHDDEHSGSNGGDYEYSYGHDIKYHGPTAIPHVLKNGHIADTHEVAAAKRAHLAAFAKESHYGYGDDYTGSYGLGSSYGHGGDYGHSYGHGHDIKYHGPIAIPHVLKSGHIADTHEVAAAKSAHLAALAKESHRGYGDDYTGSYGLGSSYGHGGDYGHSYGHGHDIKYHGPIAIPHVLKNGHIADTHEVAAAKAEHYAAVAKAKAHGGYGYAGDYGYSQGDSYGHRHSQGHHGALAKPVVLSSGYLADTHEVKAARHRHLTALHSDKYSMSHYH